MSYSDESLSIFTPIKETALLEGTAYFELPQGELPSEYACWLEGSLFIKDEAFNFFELCFKKTIADFDYLAFTRATSEEVDKLSIELASFVGQIEASSERALLFSRLIPAYPRDLWDSVGTDALKGALLKCGIAIEEYVCDTRNKNVALHILGM